MNNLGVDQDTLAASFAGAVAYLCTRDKMPVVRALAYVFAGTAAAAYVGPGLVEYLVEHSYISDSAKSQSAVIFTTGVGGIWMINLIVAILQAGTKRAGALLAGLWARMTGTPLPPAPPEDTQPEGKP